MSTHDEQQKQEEQTQQNQKEASVEKTPPSLPQETLQTTAVFDPKNLTENDFFNFIKWRELDFELDELYIKIEEAKQDYSEGHFWQAYKTVLECLKVARVGYSFHGNPEHEKTFYRLKAWFVGLQIERAMKIKRGEPDRVLPRSENTLEYVKRALERNEKPSPNTFNYQIAVSVGYALHGEIKNASRLASIIYSLVDRQIQSDPAYLGKDAMDVPIFRTAYCNKLVMNILHMENVSFKLIQYILDHEGEDILCESDLILNMIMVNLGLNMHFSSPMADHARHIRKYLLKFIELGDQERAIKLCKRYLSIQKCYICDYGVFNLHEMSLVDSEISDWTDLPEKIKMTELLLENLQRGNLQELMNAQKGVRVTVSISGGANAAASPSQPVQEFDLRAFYEDQLPGDEPKLIYNKLSTIANYEDAEGVEPKWRFCNECGEFMRTVPKSLPSAGFIAGMAISGIFAPFLIGIIPFAVLAAQRPCHYTQHYCSQCSAITDF